MPGEKQAWPKRAACWSPTMPRHGDAGRDAAAGPTVTPKRPLDGRTSGSASRGTPSSSPSSALQVQRADVEEHRAAGVGRVGGEDLAAGQVPQQPAVDRAEREVGPGRHAPPPRPPAQEPGHLRAAEVGVEDEAGALPDEREVSGARQRVAAGRGAPVLPDDGPVQRLAGVAVPGHHRLPLVGDADGGDRLVEPRRARRAAWPCTASQISTASCSTQPGRGKCCVNSR